MDSSFFISLLLITRMKNSKSILAKQTENFSVYMLESDLNVFEGKKIDFELDSQYHWLNKHTSYFCSIADAREKNVIFKFVNNVPGC